MFIVI